MKWWIGNFAGRDLRFVSNLSKIQANLQERGKRASDLTSSLAHNTNTGHVNLVTVNNDEAVSQEPGALR